MYYGGWHPKNLIRKGPLDKMELMLMKIIREVLQVMLTLFIGFGAEAPKSIVVWKQNRSSGDETCVIIMMVGKYPYERGEKSHF